MKTLILFVAVAFAACNSVHSNANSSSNARSTQAPAPVAHQSDVRRVSTTELDELMKQGKVVVVDVRGKDAYERAHIRGAKLLPLAEVGERGKELPRDKMIVTYCS
jgi:3-mercaptopyruvate sulfurtransferase SseA